MAEPYSSVEDPYVASGLMELELDIKKSGIWASQEKEFFILKKLLHTFI